jgi:hypothetical protein
MFPWQLLSPRADCDDEIRRWADLEGKSATMRDDLYREHAPQPTLDRKPKARIGVLGELVIVVLEAWWHIRSR